MKNASKEACVESCKLARIIGVIAAEVMNDVTDHHQRALRLAAQCVSRSDNKSGEF